MKIRIACNIPLKTALAQGSTFYGDFAVELNDEHVASLSIAARALLAAPSQSRESSIYDGATLLYTSSALVLQACPIWPNDSERYEPIEVSSRDMKEALQGVEKRAAQIAERAAEKQRIATEEAERQRVERERLTVRARELLALDPAEAAKDARRTLQDMLNSSRTDVAIHPEMRAWLVAWDAAALTRRETKLATLFATAPIDATDEQVIEATEILAEISSKDPSYERLIAWRLRALRRVDLREQREALDACGTESQRARWAVGRLPDEEIRAVLLQHFLPPLPFTPFEEPKTESLVHAATCQRQGEVSRAYNPYEGPCSAVEFATLGYLRECVDSRHGEDVEVDTPKFLLICTDCDECIEILTIRTRRTAGGWNLERHYSAQSGGVVRA